MNAWLIPGASVITGVLVFAGVLITALKRKPVQVTDLWDENRKLRGDLDTLRAEFDTYREQRQKDSEAHEEERSNLRRIIDVVSDGVEASWSYISVLKDALQSAGLQVPEPSEYVKKTIETARTARAAVSE